MKIENKHPLEKTWGPAGEARTCHERVCMLLQKPKYDEYTEGQKDALYEEMFRAEVIELQRMKKRAGRT